MIVETLEKGVSAPLKSDNGGGEAQNPFISEPVQVPLITEMRRHAMEMQRLRRR